MRVLVERIDAFIARQVVAWELATAALSAVYVALGFITPSPEIGIAEMAREIGHSQSPEAARHPFSSDSHRETLRGNQVGCHAVRGIGIRGRCGAATPNWGATA